MPEPRPRTPAPLWIRNWRRKSKPLDSLNNSTENNPLLHRPRVAGKKEMESSRIARHGLRLVLLRRLCHYEFRLNTVEPSGIAAEHFFLDVLRHLPFVHVIDRFPYVGRIEMRHVRRPQRVVLVKIP